MNQQRGLSLIGLIMVSALIAIVALIGFKLLPAYIEYFTIKRVVSDLANGTEVRGGTARDVMNAFDRRAMIDQISSIRSSDLEITKQGDGFIVVAAYQRCVPLISNVSVCMDFEASAP
jgi:Tfp pilus assembly major pilin PilA